MSFSDAPEPDPPIEDEPDPPIEDLHPHATRGGRDTEHAEAVDLLIQSLASGEVKRPPRSKRKAKEEFTAVGSEPTDTMALVRMRDKEQDIALKKILARASVTFVAFQLVVANVFFGFYLWHAREHTPEPIMMAWLSATVVEVIGILAIIARSLFPGRRLKKRAGKAKGERSESLANGHGNT